MSKAKTNGTASTAQSLGSIIKSARDIMRKDKGLSGELDRLPMLTWLMFLKFLDDSEAIHEAEAALEDRVYKPVIQSPYRWKDWADNAAGITGDELRKFIEQDETTLPDGEKGAGLLAYLRGLQGDGRARVIARVFSGVRNRMESGYLLRDVINKINQIHFDRKEEIDSLSHLYESMLKEMRDAAGDSGEFYTPRPVVQFMVAAINPQLGQTILDPACGTGGFLLEAFRHLRKQATNEQHWQVLQERSIYGGEAKSLPYMLAQMNLLLHGLENPQIDYGNSLTTPLTDIGDAQRVDVILTNPPFGGEEERGILDNFPDDKKTAETALLFLQLIMRKLKRPTAENPTGGQAAVVVPNGTLFADGVAARIKEMMIRDFNLHTIVRLGKGVFAPYADIPSNLLFFDRSQSTETIWYYEIPLPKGRKSYTKTNPILFEEFSSCLEWWDSRYENQLAWRVAAKDVVKYDQKGVLLSANLDIKNPNSATDLEHQSPEVLLESILQKERRIADILLNIQSLLSRKSNV